MIGTGLTRDVASADLPFRESRANVGRRAIERLLGTGRAAGDGPLVAFLTRVEEAGRARRDLELLLLRDLDGDDPDRPGPGGEFVEPIAALASASNTITATSGRLPWDDLVARIGSPGEPARVLIVGCHTEQRVLTLATLLRSVLGRIEIAVSSHLVGSATQEAHYATLRYNLPAAGVEVLLDLEGAAAFVGLDPSGFAAFGCRPCRLEPPEVREALDADRLRVLELVCMHWTRAHLRPLAGGFSGSLLFLADGWKDSARTEPMVVKVDDFLQMRRELDGYHQVKDFLGKCVPTYEHPAQIEDLIGVGMELAAMEGTPVTLQDAFESAQDEVSLGRFLHRLDKALEILSTKLYRNTCQRTWVVPYRALGLHARQQRTWFLENAGLILNYIEREPGAPERFIESVHPDTIAKVLESIAANPDGIESEVCLCHGDLNLANLICDEGDNLWFIDWTHGGSHPIELDFAKIENDVKFVLTKEFDPEDLPRLKKFEEYLLSGPWPADANELPDELKFARWDLRFRRILGSVRRIRRALFALKTSDDWVVYRIALLRYALHTLSFDRRRGRGECQPTQLMHALYSVRILVFGLVVDDFHIRIRGDRPPSYPPRHRISIDDAPWSIECPGYDPPYHVDPGVLASDRTKDPNGWAEPEDVGDGRRPLHPRGRRGLAGRGLLGRWGPNLSVAGVVLRSDGRGDARDILLGRVEGSGLDLPKGFVRPDESPDVALARILATETGWRPRRQIEPEVVTDGYAYDPRETDNAWVESRASLVVLAFDEAPTSFGTGGGTGGETGGEFEEVAWHPLDPATINRLAAGQAALVRAAIERLAKSGRLDPERTEALLAKTG